MAKRDALEKKMYNEIKKGNFEKADLIRKKIVALDVATLKERI